MMRVFKRVIEKEDKEALIFYMNYTRGVYDIKEVEERTTKKELLKLYKKGETHKSIFIESRFNDICYQFHDLDNKEHFDTFKQLYKDKPYVIFESSNGKYWGILDIKTDIKDVIKNSFWLVCNDDNYVKYAKSKKKMLIRGVYQDDSRIPEIYEENMPKEFSDNFSKFIKKLEEYYNNESLELSALKFKDTKLLLRLNRKKKLEKIRNEAWR